jgi:aminotransferase
MSGAVTARRLAALAPGGLTALVGEAHGQAAVNLALGTPAAPVTPPAMVDAACAALREGLHQYEMPDGSPELRRRIGTSLVPPADPLTEVTVTVGATEALSVALLATLDPGDEVIVLEPFYENFMSAIVVAGGVPRIVPLRPPEWRYESDELRAAFGPRTRAVVLNTPHNPTGRVFDRDELCEIAALCEHWGATVISDEVYSGFTFDGHPHVSAAAVPGLEERSIVVGSLSKSHAVSGWRLGFLRACPALTAMLRQVHLAVAGVAATPLQAAAARAADFGPPPDDLVRQRDAALGAFSALGLDCIAPEGACYVMCATGPVTDADSETFVKELVRDTGVLVAPGRFFYASPGGGADFIRVAFNRPVQVFEEVAERLRAVTKTRVVVQ